MSDTAFFRFNGGNTWRPVIMRGGLAFLIGAMTALGTAGATMDEAVISSMGWFRWLLFWSTVILAGLVNLRSFIDDSLGRQKRVIEDVKLGVNL